MTNAVPPLQFNRTGSHQGSGLAALMAGSAGLMLLAITIVVWLGEPDWQICLAFAVDTMLLLGASVLALGPERHHLLGALWLWTASGLTLALVVIAIFGIGLGLLIPLVFIGGGLAAWPRPAGRSIFTRRYLLAEIVGFLAVFGTFLADMLITG